MPNSISDCDPRTAIRARAKAEGFDVVRFARAEAARDTAAHLKTYLEQGRHGSMDWMARDPERRADPKELWPDAKSVVLLGFNYGPAIDPLSGTPDQGRISVYARGDDYHDVLKPRLRLIAQYMADTFHADVKLFIDTAPVMEKPLAQSGGLGWQGKHTNLVSREFGSWLFIGSIFTTLEIEPDEAETDHCGHCHKCLDACPTDAFTGPYRIDARRCISYLTIEHKGHIPREFRVPIGNRIYGCDDCLAVCPWNKFAKTANEAKFHARAELENPDLRTLAKLDDAEFRALFRRSPVKRVKRDRFIRNVLIAIGNSGNPEMAKDAEHLLQDESPLVRAMAVWALGRLTPQHAAELAARYGTAEPDQAVQEEWRAVSAFSPVPSA